MASPNVGQGEGRGGKGRETSHKQWCLRWPDQWVSRSSIAQTSSKTSLSAPAPWPSLVLPTPQAWLTDHQEECGEAGAFSHYAATYIYIFGHTILLVGS